ncbi:hypothetical protein V5O48_007362 [Marasmius crinis-equi]|uniref:Uncharacterized protein n=1 Tax=Marasmius crinis-equi TaxID=585013 RepID=A0ABR3FGX3_9AGAR
MSLPQNPGLPTTTEVLKRIKFHKNKRAHSLDGEGHNGDRARDPKKARREDVAQIKLKDCISTSCLYSGKLKARGVHDRKPLSENPRAEPSSRSEVAVKRLQPRRLKAQPPLPQKVSKAIFTLRPLASPKIFSLGHHLPPTAVAIGRKPTRGLRYDQQKSSNRLELPGGSQSIDQRGKSGVLPLATKLTGDRINPSRRIAPLPKTAMNDASSKASNTTPSGSQARARPASPRHSAPVVARSSQHASTTKPSAPVEKLSAGSMSASSGKRSGPRVSSGSTVTFTAVSTSTMRTRVMSNSPLNCVSCPQSSTTSTHHTSRPSRVLTRNTSRSKSSSSVIRGISVNTSVGSKRDSSSTFTTPTVRSRAKNPPPVTPTATTPCIGRAQSSTFTFTAAPSSNLSLEGASDPQNEKESTESVIRRLKFKKYGKEGGSS